MDPVAQPPEGAGGAEQLRLHGEVHATGEVGFQVGAAVVDVDGDQGRERPDAVDGQVHQGDVVHRAHRLGQDVGEGPQAGAGTSGEDDRGQVVGHDGWTTRPQQAGPPPIRLQ